MAELIVTPEALEQLQDLPSVVVARVSKLLERLERWPTVSGAKPLSGRLAGHWRMRSGDYRVQFRLEGNSIIVERVNHRDGFYER